jgi:hypothetical protein
VKKIKIILFFFGCGLVLLLAADAAYANPGLILHGLGKTLFSVVQLPTTMLQHAACGAFPVSLVTGAVAGTYKTVAGTASGVMEMAVGAAPYAKYMVFFL